MKKFLSLVLLLTLSITLVSCTKDKDKDANENMKVYAKEYTEEFEGNPITYEYQIALKDDSFGYLIMQDIVPIKYDDKNILSYTNDIVYPYEIVGDTLYFTRPDLDLTEEFVLTDKPLDDTILEWIKEVDEREASLAE